MQRTFEISIGAATELWIQWAWIALDQRDSARLAHERAGGPLQAIPNCRQQWCRSWLRRPRSMASRGSSATLVASRHEAPPPRIPHERHTSGKRCEPTSRWRSQRRPAPRAQGVVEASERRRRRPSPSANHRARARAVPAPSRCTCAEDIHRPKRHALDRGHGGDLHDVHARGSTPRPRRPLSARPGLHHCGLHRRVCSTRCPRRPPPVAARRMAIRPRRASRFAACSTPTTVRRRRREVQARLSADHSSFS